MDWSRIGRGLVTEWSRNGHGLSTVPSHGLETVQRAVKAEAWLRTHLQCQTVKYRFSGGGFQQGKVCAATLRPSTRLLSSRGTRSVYNTPPTMAV